MSFASFCFRSSRALLSLHRAAKELPLQHFQTRSFRLSPVAQGRGPKFRVHNEDTDLPLASSDDDDRQPRKYVFVSDDDERLFEDDESIAADRDEFESDPDDEDVVRDALWERIDATDRIDAMDPDRHFAEWKSMAAQHEDVDTQGIKWAEVALLATSSLDALTLHSFSVNVGRRLIYITLDKFIDAYGSPSMDEIALFSTRLMDRLNDALGGAVAESLHFEVSSPGAERIVRVPFELMRFQSMPMKVLYQLNDADGDSRTATKILEFIRHDSELTVWKNWKERNQKKKGSKGRSKVVDFDQEMTIPIRDLLHVHLYLDL